MRVKKAELSRRSARFTILAPTDKLMLAPVDPHVMAAVVSPNGRHSPSISCVSDAAALNL